MELNRKWHSRLPIINNWVNCNLCYGAIYDGIYYAIAMWSNPTARLIDHRTVLELRRMAIAPDAPKNTASRMLRIMKYHIRKKMPKIVKLISYQDTEAHKGTIYKASGWRKADNYISRRRIWEYRPNRTTQACAPRIRWELNILEAEGAGER